ncbi:hypothetical protein SVIOM74S_01410 [Streptomyces violarus]
MQGGQGGFHQLAQGEAVEAQHRQIVRNAPAVAAGGAHRPDRDQVVEAEDRGDLGPRRQEPLHTGLAAGHTVLRAHRDPVLVDRQSEAPHLLQERQPAGAGPVHAVQHADPAVPRAEQVVQALLDSGGGVDAHGGETGLLRAALQKHQRHAAEVPGEDVVRVLEVAHDGVRLVGEHVERLPLPGLVDPGVPHDHLPAALLGRLQHPGGDLGEERVAQVGDDQARRHGALLDESAREPAGPVVQEPGRLQDPLLGGRVDLTLVVDRPGDRLP